MYVKMSIFFTESLSTVHKGNKSDESQEKQIGKRTKLHFP